MNINIDKDCQYIELPKLLSIIVDNRGKSVPTCEKGIVLIATNCIKNTSLYPVFEKVRYLSQETYETWFRAHPLPGDIIFVNKGTPGRVCLVPDPVNFCIAQDMMAFRADDKKIYNRYLFAVLRSDYIQKTITNCHVGTLIPHFKKSHLNQLLIPVPDREIQEKIGDFYFALSNKIELNTRMNKVLEEIAQALFHRWFVEFEFPNADGKPYQSAGGKMVESEMGCVPEGWSVGTIGDIVQILGGSTPDTKNPVFWENGEYPFCTPKDLSALISPILLETGRCITEEGVQSISSKCLPAGALLLSSRAPVGYLAISAVPVSINQGFIGMICNEEISNVFLLQWLRENMEIIKGRANGSTFQEISKRNFRTIPFLIPSADVLSQYNSIVKPLYNQIAALTKESVELSGIRDTLLPKLMSGEILCDC